MEAMSAGHHPHLSSYSLRHRCHSAAHSSAIAFVEILLQVTKSHFDSFEYRLCWRLA